MLSRLPRGVRPRLEGKPRTPLSSRVATRVSWSPLSAQRFTELGREEKGEGGDRGDLVEKKESPKGERAVKPVISLPSEKWVLKIGFLKVQNW